MEHSDLWSSKPVTDDFQENMSSLPIEPLDLGIALWVIRWLLWEVHGEGILQWMFMMEIEVHD